MVDHNDDLGKGHASGEPNPEEEFREMLQEFLNGVNESNQSEFSAAAGLPNDPSNIAAIFQQLKFAMNSPSTTAEGIDWAPATRQGEERAAQNQRQITEEEKTRYDQTAKVAALWLDEVTDVTGQASRAEPLTRRAWVTATMPVWSQLAEPVAGSIADALTRVMRENAPEDMEQMMEQASRMLRSVGSALFAMQLGQVVGQLATEVVSGGDIGIPIMPDGQFALLPQNIAAFGDGLDIPLEEIELYLTVRELAHARLFRHAKWLRLHFTTAITAYARGIDIDTDRLESLAERFDPQNPEELRSAVQNGELLKPRNETQKLALNRIETMLALVEGWVDVVTAAATSRLPRNGAIAETIRRRRAAGGPAEHALGTLVGLELRPRRLRDAASMWEAITAAIGVPARDGLWAHPDLVPTTDDLDDPQALVTRMTGKAPTDSEGEAFDKALAELLRGTDNTGGSQPSSPGE